MPKEPKFSVFFYNSITYLGVFLALFILLIEFFLFAVDFMAHGKNLYLGLITYIYLPPFLILGLLLIPIGAFWKRRRVRAGTSSVEPKTFRIDPSLPEHRNAIFVFTAGTTLLVFMTFVGAYKGFHYTESVEFCGVLCHKVMNPEYQTYLQSPHGKVRCVECHVGQGADWYAKSKMTGAQQAFHALTNSYEKPIQTPVKALRPAQDTCTQCHWPGKHFGVFDFNRVYYTSEAQDEPWRIRMHMNVGGGDRQPRGIHAHMNIENDVYYAAEDDKRQEITWVRSVDKSGKETVFVSPGSKWEAQPPAPSEIRKMDCIDCHNRPTHRFQAPYRLLNDSMQFGEIDPSIPGLKEKGMEVLSKEYAATDEAVRSIEEELKEYYRTKQADYYQENAARVDEAIRGIQRIFQNNMFPEMKVRWDTHPDNIGHMIAPGCFRCHDGEHRSAEDRIITNDCKACHRIIEQGPLGATEKDLDGVEFKHPVDIGDDWKTSACTDCHSGGA